MLVRWLQCTFCLQKPQYFGTYFIKSGANGANQGSTFLFLKGVRWQAEQAGDCWNGWAKGIEDNMSPWNDFRRNTNSTISGITAWKSRPTPTRANHRKLYTRSTMCGSCFCEVHWEDTVLRRNTINDFHITWNPKCLQTGNSVLLLFAL